MKKACLFFLFFFSVLFIDARQISIKIVDKDIQLPLEGVKIIVKNNQEIFYTNEEGKVLIEVDDAETRVILSAELIGYEPKKVNIKEFDEEALVSMVIEGVLEGKELVIEEDAIGKTDAEVGVSNVIKGEELKLTSELGLIEDVMTSVKTLPGVTYSGGYDSKLSIRGGQPEELTAFFDGFLVRKPFHWRYIYSIFNPNIISSVKFSNGIFSSRYGSALSGILEFDSEKPDDGLKIESKITTTSFDAFVQIPLPLKKSGILFGFTQTFMDLPFLIYEKLRTSGVIENTGMGWSTSPFVRDVYLKWYWKPNDRFEWYINSFFLSDGVGITYREPGKDERKEIVVSYTYDYYCYQAIAVTGFKFFPTDTILIHFLTGYNFILDGEKNSSSENGTQNYSAAFLALPDVVTASPTFTIDNINSSSQEDNYLHGLESKFDIDILLHKKIMLSTGTGFFYDYSFKTGSGSYYSIVDELGHLVYKEVEVNLDPENRSLFKSFLFLEFSFDIFPSIFKIDVGCRLDHLTLFGEDSFLNSYPVVNPRLKLSYTPVQNLIFLDHLTLSAGFGLFSKAPSFENKIANGININGFKMPKSLATVLGCEVEFPLGFKFKLEGYYKYYFDRFYVNATKGLSDTQYFLNSDGIGHVAGFDLLLQRKFSRYIDGWISYSFIFARYLNPESDNISSCTTDDGEPTGSWYYPSFHRFHNLNLVLNVKPFSWLTITTSLSFATGVPKKKAGAGVPYPVSLSDGTLIEMTNTQYYYSDTLRKGFSMPLDIKISFNAFFPKRKVRFEAYIAVEDLLIQLYYEEEDGISTDKYSDSEIPSPEADIVIPIPMPSLGIKINY